MFRNCYKKWLWKIVFENSFLQDPDEHNAKHPSTGEVHVIKLASVSTRGKKLHEHKANYNIGFCNGW